MPSLSRQTWVIVHRWAGLTIAAFLVVAGATGAILPWRETLTLASRPALSRAAPPHAGARPLDGAVLADRVERQTGGRVGFLRFDVPTDHVAIVFVGARPGSPPLPYNVVWADPYSGQIRLAFRYAMLADGVQNIVPFLYRLHYSLALGTVGIWAFGIAALVWALDCFVGFYLTWPIRARLPGPRPDQRSWWKRWAPSWRVRWTAGGHKRSFDLHRAGGLWLWPLLFVFAWSGFALNLPDVEKPVVAAFGGHGRYHPKDLPTPVAGPTLDLAGARARGSALMAEQAKRHGFRIEREGNLYHDAAAAAYRYAARTSLDASDEEANTLVWLDARTGALLSFEPPQGTAVADKVDRWMLMLHLAEVFGLPYRILVSVIGVGVAALSVTGVLIWMRKRAARILGERKRGAAPPRRAGPPTVSAA